MKTEKQNPLEKIKKTKKTEEIFSFEEKKEEFDEKSEKKFLSFSSGNPDVEEITGKLHLYKNQGKFENLPLKIDQLPEKTSLLVVVLAVPSFMSVVDFFNFLASYLDDITKIRIVKDDSPNRYMGVLKFKKQEDANMFYQEYNGRPFNSLDPEECKLLFLSHITIDSEFDNITFQDIGIPSPKNLDGKLVLKENSKFEIPSCPICLEILDSETSGIVTTMCNHTFHCQCLNKWAKPTCPCCRYDHELSESVCFECGEKKNLWVCLICGYIGCSRYLKAHSADHFEKTNHNYSLELETRRVWDYLGDGYVHRLIASKGGITEIPRPKTMNSESSEVFSDEIVEVEFANKMDFICQEYNQLLSSQLDSQRIYFERKLRDATKDLELKLKDFEKINLELENENKKNIKRVEVTNSKLKKLNEEKDLLKNLNENLIKNQQEFKKQFELKTKQHVLQIESKDELIHDLESQVKDLMFYLDTQKQVEDCDDKESIQSGQLIVTKPNVETTSTKKKKSKKSK
eukprot:gene6287-10294_t